MNKTDSQAVLDVPKDVIERAAKIKLLLMDVDGVLTDGTIFYVKGAEADATEFKGFNSQDGLGMHFLNSVGIKTGVISGRESPSVTKRAQILKMSYVYQGHLEKMSIYEEILGLAGVKDEEVAFVGDDFTDAPLMKRVGLACAVADARPELFSVVHFVTHARGGKGAIREIIEIILKAQKKWDSVLSTYGLTGL